MHESRRRAVMAWAGWSVALTSTAFLAFMIFEVGGEWTNKAVDDLAELVAALLAAIACTVASRRSGRGRVGWGFLAASSAAWAFGEAVWTYNDLVRGVELPSPSVADIGFLASVPLAVIGLHNLFQRPVRSTSRNFNLLIAGAGATAMVVFVILAAVHPADPSADGVAQQLVGLAYPAGDLIMAAVVLNASRQGTGDQTTMRFVLAGIAALIVADTWLALVVIVGDFGMPYWLDSGWVVGYLLIALGALRSSMQSESSAEVPWGAPTSRQPAMASTAPGVPWMTARPHVIGWPAGHSLATMNARHVVSSAVILLMAIDAAVVLYDLATVLRLFE